MAASGEASEVNKGASTADPWGRALLVGLMALKAWSAPGDMARECVRTFADEDNVEAALAAATWASAALVFSANLRLAVDT